MKYYTRDDIVESACTFQQAIIDGYTYDSRGNYIYNVVQFGHTLIANNKVIRNGAKASIECALVGWYNSSNHIVIGTIPDGFRPKRTVYALGGRGVADSIQIRLDPNGDIDFWANGIQPFSLDHVQNTSEKEPDPAENLIGGFTNYTKVTYTKNGETVPVPIELAIRFNVSYEVQDE